MGGGGTPPVVKGGILALGRDSLLSVLGQKAKDLESMIEPR